MSTHLKPYSAACDRNRDPILKVLEAHLEGQEHVLEIGSGTGQHAVYFAQSLPGLTWHTSDRSENLAGIRGWLSEAGLANTPDPLNLDVNSVWPEMTFDAVFTANTFHIMAWPEVVSFFDHLPFVLREGGHLFIYGPFNENGAFTSESNAVFDASLRAQNSRMGIRDLEKVVTLAKAAGFQWTSHQVMPANNRCLIFRRTQQGT